jgi:hypothetical protein
VRFATFNLENLFARPKVFNLETWAEGEPILKAFAEFNALIERVNYTDADKARMIELLLVLEVYRLDNGIVRRNRLPDPKWAWLRANRGTFDVEHEDTGVEIVADHRADWTGWLELAKEPVDEVTTNMTAQVILDVNADVQGVVEGVSRFVRSRVVRDALSESNGRGGSMARRSSLLIVAAAVAMATALVGGASAATVERFGSATVLRGVGLPGRSAFEGAGQRRKLNRHVVSLFTRPFPAPRTTSGLAGASTPTQSLPTRWEGTFTSRSAEPSLPVTWEGTVTLVYDERRSVPENITYVVDWTNGRKGVGPSTNDEENARRRKTPGGIYDYVDSPSCTNSIPAGHPKESPYRYYLSGPRQRPTPR